MNAYTCLTSAVLRSLAQNAGKEYLRE